MLVKVRTAFEYGLVLTVKDDDHISELCLRFSVTFIYKKKKKKELLKKEKAQICYILAET